MKSDPDDDYLLDDDEDDDGDRRHWKSRNGGKSQPYAGGDSQPRRDSGSSTTTSTVRPRTSSSEWDQERDRDRNHDRTRDHENDHDRQQKQQQPQQQQEQAQAQAQTQGSKPRKPAYPRTVSFSEDGRSSNNRSPMQHHTESHRVPYFRYFGPTAIVPGYKQMVVNVSVKDRRRSRGGSFSATSPDTTFADVAHHDPVFESIEDLPVYGPNDSSPVHPLTMSLIRTFFLHLGCNYPFLQEEKFMRMVKEKSVDAILVDAMCALAARFSDLPAFTNNGKGGTVSRSEYGHVFAQRAKAATVDTFPCPSVGAVQACLLMAYEGFGANQDSALWMYLGLAIRMAVDLGLQKMVGVMYQGEKDPWYTRTLSRKSSDDGMMEHRTSHATVAADDDDLR